MSQVLLVPTGDSVKPTDHLVVEPCPAQSMPVFKHCLIFLFPVPAGFVNGGK